MKKQEYVDAFLLALESAATKMNDDFFQIKFCNPSEYNVLKFRERVFCYELYHQLRISLGNGFLYKLHGEMDKMSHETYKKSELKNTVPDFIVHKPGEPDNLLVMEVKHKESGLDKIEKDFKKLRNFKIIAGYETGISYVFGELQENDEKRLKDNLGDGILLFLHRSQYDYEIYPKK